MMCMKQISTFNNNRKGRTSLLFYITFIIIGIVSGAFISEKESLSSCVWINQCFQMQKSVRSFFLLASMILFLFAAFLAGLSAVGQPFGLLLLVYRGVGIGVSAGAMYALRGQDAILPVIITFLPIASAVSVISALAVRESVRNSGIIFSFCLSRSEDSYDRPSFRLYCVRFIVLIIFSIFASAVNEVIIRLYISVRR